MTKIDYAKLRKLGTGKDTKESVKADVERLKILASNAAKIAKPVMRAPGPLAKMYPSRKLVKLVWSQKIPMTTGTTQDNFGGEFVFRLNSIYQSMLTAGQINRVQGYDQLADTYGKYKVFAVGVNIEFSDPSIDGLHYGCQIQSSDSTNQVFGLKLGSLQSKKWAVTKALNNTGSQVSRYSRYFPMHKLEGLTKNQYNGDVSEYTANFNANPTKIPFIRIAIVNTASTANATMNALVSLTYYTALNERLILDSSII